MDNPIFFSFTHWWKHLGFFLFLAIMNNVALNIRVQVFVWICLHFSWVSIEGRNFSQMLYLMRKCQTGFQSGCCILHSHWQGISFWLLCILNTTWCYLFYYSHPSWYDVASSWFWFAFFSWLPWAPFLSINLLSTGLSLSFACLQLVVFLLLRCKYIQCKSALSHIHDL